MVSFKTGNKAYHIHLYRIISVSRINRLLAMETKDYGDQVSHSSGRQKEKKIERKEERTGKRRVERWKGSRFDTPSGALYTKSLGRSEAPGSILCPDCWLPISVPTMSLPLTFCARSKGTKASNEFQLVLLPCNIIKFCLYDTI